MRRAVGCLHWFGAMDLVFQHTVGTTNWKSTCAAVLIGGLCHKDTTPSSQEQLSLVLPEHSCLHCSAPLLSLGLRRDSQHFWDTTAAKEKTSISFWEGLAGELERKRAGSASWNIFISRHQPATSQILLWFCEWTSPQLLHLYLFHCPFGWSQHCCPSVRPRGLWWESASLKGFYWIEQNYNGGSGGDECGTSPISTIYCIFSFFSLSLSYL